MGEKSYKSYSLSTYGGTVGITQARGNPGGKEIAMEEIKLKPCPFCGGKGEIFRGTTYGFHYLYEPRCITCECALGVYETEEQAIEAWNRRADNG